MTRVCLLSWGRWLCAAVIGGCLSPVAVAAEVAWRTERFQYVAQKKDLAELLREFALNQGIVANVAEGVQGSVSGRFDMPPRAMLELMASSHGFVWYFDGVVLQIAPSSAMRTEVIHLRYASVARLEQMLQRLGVTDRRFPLRTSAATATVVVSGPPAFVELVQQVAQSAEREQSRRLGSELRVFPLRHAWAADREFDSRGQRQLVPGVASVLRSMYRSKSPALRVPSHGTSRVPSLRKPNGPGARGAANPPGAGAPAFEGADTAAAEGDSALPVIEADTRINAVLVRDLPAYMAQHEATIRSLDIEPSVIEIEARVIEVNSADSERLGVDWRVASRRSELQVGSAHMEFPQPVPDRHAGQPEAPLPGGVLTTVLGDSGRFLLARITALSDEGKARIAANPKVLTLNNQEAVMDQTESFHVRVAGYQTAELFNITTGLTLRVTPSIVEGGGPARIRLEVRIEDGRLTDGAVDQIPVIKRSEISTQAFIQDGEALLIGGYVQETTTVNDSGVPGLSKLPLVGALFRHRRTESARVERMFLLVPRIVGRP